MRSIILEHEKLGLATVFVLLGETIPVIDFLFNASVTGLPPHLGGVAHALGPWQWTNNSTDLA